VLLTVAIVLAGCSPRAPQEQAAAEAARHERGREIYNFRCYFCHGYSGDARTLAATYLSPAPRDLRAATPQSLPHERIVKALHDGRPGTAMTSFRGVLDEAQIDDVAAFVAREFVADKAANTRYHTAANGWPDHERYEAAFPFARGDVPLDAAPEHLDAAQRAGRHLFLHSCVSCHDRARVRDEGPAWSARPVSYPRFGFEPGQPNTPPVDAVSSASVYAKHEVVPQIAGMTPIEQRCQTLFQANCAFCHGGDGTGKNWIGQFMEPKARDLTQYDARTMPPQRLRATILDGLPDTSMPAWRAVLAADEVDAVAAYVERAFFHPAR
jgi:cytochrome c oxidase cbb3-type subunit 3